MSKPILMRVAIVVLLVSGLQTMAAADLASAMSHAPKKGSIHVPRVVFPGETFDISGRLPIKRKIEVRVQQRRPGGPWRTVRKISTNKKGRFDTPISAPGPGRVSYRAVATGMLGGKTHQWRTRRASMTVRPYSALSRLQVGPHEDVRVSGNGDWIVFSAFASNVIPGVAATGVLDVFTYQRSTGSITRVTAGNGSSRGATVSDDGGVIAFLSEATNLAPGDLAATSDLFVWERATGSTSRLTNAQEPPPDVPDDSINDTVSAAVAGDGQSVAFTSRADDLAGEGGHSRGMVYRWDRVSGSIELVAHEGDAGWVDTSDSGNVIAYSVEDSGGHGAVLVWQSGSESPRVVAADLVDPTLVSVSDDGRALAYGGRFVGPVIVADLSTGSATASPATMQSPTISGDGRWLMTTARSVEDSRAAVLDRAGNLVSGVATRFEFRAAPRIGSVSDDGAVAVFSGCWRTDGCVSLNGSSPYDIAVWEPFVV